MLWYCPPVPYPSIFSLLSIGRQIACPQALRLVLTGARAENWSESKSCPSFTTRAGSPPPKKPSGEPVGRLANRPISHPQVPALMSVLFTRLSEWQLLRMFCSILNIQRGELVSPVVELQLLNSFSAKFVIFPQISFCSALFTDCLMTGTWLLTEQSSLFPSRGSLESSDFKFTCTVHWRPLARIWPFFWLRYSPGRARGRGGCHKSKIFYSWWIPCEYARELLGWIFKFKLCSWIPCEYARELLGWIFKFKLCLLPP